MATTEGNRMRRVLLLVCLIVSMVELDWERARVYFLSSVGSLLLVVWSELLRLRKAQKTTTAEELRAEQMVLPEAQLVLPNPQNHAATGAGKDAAVSAEKGTRVAIYSTEDARISVAHFFERI